MAKGQYFKDLQSYVDALRRSGELKVIRGADWDLDIGTLTEMAVEIKNHPALLFESIKDYPGDRRLLTNAMTTVRRTATAMGLPEDVHPLEMLRIWKDKRAGFQRTPPTVVEKALVKQNVLLGHDVDIHQFPAPRWHEADGGKYIGTGNAVIMREPGGDWVNVGLYRMMVHDKNTLAVYFSPGKHGLLILQQAIGRNENLPVAVSFGHDPVLALSAAMPFSFKVCEYELAGWLLESPYEVTLGPVTGLPIPANAEIVMEGEIISSEKRLEGPFGEFTGYYATGATPQPIIKVKSILYRDNPIVLGIPPVKPLRPHIAALPFIAAETWDALEKAGVPDVRGVWQAGGIWFPFFTIVAINQRYGGHAKQAGLVACGAKGSAFMGRFIVVVDDDIDITSLEDVIWAISTRCDPAESIEIIRDCWSSPLDPILYRSNQDTSAFPAVSSRLIINACKPYQWRDRFPRTNVASPELRKRTKQKFEEFFKEISGERKTIS